MIGIRWLILAALGVAASQPAAPSTQQAGPSTHPAAPSTHPVSQLIAATQVVIPATQPTAAAGPATRPAAVVALGDPAQLLGDLADSDWHVRRHAQERLVKAGEDAKPFIQALVEKATSDEARKNAQAALQEIDDNRRIGPSYLTLHFKNAPASEVMAEISRQCFTPLLTAPEHLFQQESFPTVTVDVDRQPFWEVVPKICQQLGVDFRHFQGGMHIMRSGGMQAEGINRIEGPFLIVATQITFSRTRSFTAKNEQTQFGMQIAVYPEPKLNVLRGSGSIQVEQAIDDNGNSLLPEGASLNRVWGGFMGFGGWSLYAPLHYPKNIGSRIARFKGNTGFVIQVESQKVEFPNLASFQPATRFIYDMPVLFESFKKEGDIWKLHLHVNQPDFSGSKWQQFMEGVQNRLQVLDAAGNALDHRGMSTSSNNTVMDLSLDFARSNGPTGQMSGDPVRLVWEVPTKTANSPCRSTSRICRCLMESKWMTG